MRRREFCELIGGALATLPAAKLLANDSAREVASDVPALKLNGEQTVLEKAALRDLRASLRGQLILPGDEQYEGARRIWNGMIDRRPAAIAWCANADDVKRAVTFARERQLLSAVRGGGHSFPGHSTCDKGLVIDLSAMRAVKVDAAHQTARVEGGAWIGDLDAATQAHGLATTMGQISNTGVGGLTLGGGFGWLSHRFGMACDNLIAVDLVTADGQLRRVTAEDSPDLFWALRGGGGNFGVATAFEFRLHKVGPQVLAGHVSWPRARAKDVIEFYEDFASHAPRELDVDLSLEPGPDGQSAVAIYLCHCGDVHAGEKALEPLRKLGKPIEDAIKVQDYLVVQRQFDGPSPDPNNHYLKGGFVREFSPGLVEKLAEFVASKELNLYFENSCGAVADTAPTATAFPYRHAITNMMIAASWPDAADNERRVAELRRHWDALVPFTEGYYSNLNDADQKSIDRNYGVNHARLLQLKQRYDPLNQFRLNANIRAT
ncbi:MAG TPA: FAD-binding oxidoreductase [Steroidobacteraceae bacterium]|jgi:hypothetical protein